MKNKFRIGGVIISVAAGMLLSSAAMAHHAGKANQSYVGAAGGSGHYITDSSGNCVRTGSWNESDKTVDCGAAPKVEAKAPPPPAPAPPPAPKYETMSLSAGALFDTNSDAIKAEGKAELDDVASKIGGTARVSDIKIVGHTDSMGKEDYNQQLSVRRATAVRDYLATRGVDRNLMSISGMGESSPVADNSTKAGRAQNRRVEVMIGVTKQVK
jgi:OOP family OmpA-OmpF porin